MKIKRLTDDRGQELDLFGSILFSWPVLVAIFVVAIAVLAWAIY